MIDSLVSTLVLDPSANCRFTAVEALYAHADSDIMRTAIHITCPREQSPLVQLAMIDFLAAIRNRDAARHSRSSRPALSPIPACAVAAGRALTQL